MANLTTDGKICIDREIDVLCPVEDYGDIIPHFEINETCKWITENHFSKVCLQFPDDMLSISARVYKEIKNQTNTDLYILGDTSYASCCVDTVAAMHVQGDAIVHYGHTCFTKTNIPVFTVLPRKDLDIMTVAQLFTNLKGHENVCLFYDTVYEHCKDEISKIWYKQYPHSYMAEIELNEKPNRFCGRVIKDKDNVEFPVEVVKDYTCVYLGSKNQAMFNLTISVQAANWYCLDPETQTIEHTNEIMWFKRRRFLIEKCKDAKNIGILICKLAGNQTKDIINRMKKLCKVNGKKSYIICWQA